MSVSKDRILYQDDHLLAVNKLSGELVVKGSGKVQKLPLFDFLKKENHGLRVLHRLDFETSGVVVFAKTQEAYDAVRASNFAGWKKVYRTIVISGRGAGIKREGEIRMPLPARGQGKVESVTRYRILKNLGSVAYIEAEIETGRHHQIRRHFEGIGCPLVLDTVYGNEKFNRSFAREFRYRKFFLHAFCVELPHPVAGEKLHIQASLPKTFEEVLKKLS